MYIHMKDDYQFHIPTEWDRAWLTETMTTELYTPSQAIEQAEWNGISPDFVSPIKFSRIISRNSDNARIAWMLSTIVNKTICTHAVAIHPSFRGQGFLRPVTEASYFWSFNRAPIVMEGAVVIIDTNYVPKADLSPTPFTVVHEEGTVIQTAVDRSESIQE